MPVTTDQYVLFLKAGFVYDVQNSETPNVKMLQETKFQGKIALCSPSYIYELT